MTTFGWGGGWAASSRATGLCELGAAKGVIGLTGIRAPLAGAIDMVGGSQLADLLGLLEPHATAVWGGRASPEPFVLPVDQVEAQPPWCLEQFHLTPPVGADLAEFLLLVERSELTVPIGMRANWNSADEAARALIERRVEGKVVLVPADQQSVRSAQVARLR